MDSLFSFSIQYSKARVQKQDSSTSLFPTKRSDRPLCQAEEVMLLSEVTPESPSLIIMCTGKTAFHLVRICTTVLTMIVNTMMMGTSIAMDTQIQHLATTEVHNASQRLWVLRFIAARLPQGPSSLY